MKKGGKAVIKAIRFARWGVDALENLSLVLADLFFCEAPVSSVQHQLLQLPGCAFGRPPAGVVGAPGE